MTKFRSFTMIPRSIYLRNLLVVAQVRRVPGCVVECGTWRGGMIAGIADVLGPSRRYCLFDSFEGLPPAKDVDGPAAKAWQGNPRGTNYFNNCTADVDSARAAMARSRAKNFDLYPGWFEQTLAAFEPPEPIAVLRLDADWFEATLLCLQRLHHFVARDGVIIIDDYFTWDGCARAVHRFLSDHDSTRRVREPYPGVCTLVNG